MGESIQCVITDLDYTLLNSQREIHPDDLAALCRLRERGIPFTFVTGRHYMFARKFVRLTGLRLPFSSSNGALIWDPAAGKALKINTLDPALCRRVVSYGISLGIPMSVHAVSGIYATASNPRLQVFRDFNSHLDDPADYFMPEILEPDSFSYEYVFKISAYNQEGQDVKVLLSPILDQTGLQTDYSESCLLDITRPDSTKADGVRALAHFIGFDPAHAMAFGDNHNDLSLLKSVGHPIAMANAVPELKAVAEFVTRSCDEAGVSFALQKFWPHTT